jgi:ribosomal protein L40E
MPIVICRRCGERAALDAETGRASAAAKVIEIAGVWQLM